MNQEQTNITTGKQIRHLRTQLGMTQEELAGELNVTRQALSNWERDVNEPDLNMLKKICFLFGVNMDDFAKEVIYGGSTPIWRPSIYFSAGLTEMAVQTARSFSTALGGGLAATLYEI